MAVMAASKADTMGTMPMAAARRPPRQPTVRAMTRALRMVVLEPVPVAAVARLTRKEAASADKAAACTPKTMVKRRLGLLVPLVLGVAPVEAVVPMEA